MNGLKCPNCDLINLLDAQSCHRCRNSLQNLPNTAQVSVPIDETFRAQAFHQKSNSDIPRDNETGQKTFFWYRVYCFVMLMIYLCLVGIGLLLASFPDESGSQQVLVTGIAYAISGGLFALIFGVALFLPRRPFNWIVGIVMIAIGMMSCCFLPATIPLLIFWVKPETKAYFGRS